jgi:hypothetical protein
VKWYENFETLNARFIAQVAQWQGMPPQVYGVEEPPIRRFLAELDKRYGGARAWALSNGARSEALTYLEHELLVVRTPGTTRRPGTAGSA